MIDTIFDEGLNGSTCYSHNFGRFDSAFVLAAANQLFQQGLASQSDPEADKCVYEVVNPLISYQSGRSMKSFEIRRTLEGKETEVLIFRDSLGFLPGSLEDIAGHLTEEAKGAFPHRFVTPYNLDYRGPLPSVEFFEGAKVPQHTGVT